ncbi:MAG TPA: 3'-5' exonuclease [Prochlorococcus sp.]
MDVEEAVVSSSEAVEPLLEAASSPQPLAVALPSFTSQASIPLPETLLILDTETSGLDPKQDHCLEVGAILFHAPRRAVLAQHSFLLPVQDNAAESINHIPADVTRLNQPWREGLEYFQALLDAAELLVAHNAAFDRQWFGKDHLPAVSKPWLCTMEDIAWPVDRQLRSRPSVRDLALAYGVPVWAAHRALTDCIYLAEVFCRCNDLETLLLHGLEPRRLMRAQVSYQQRHLAKQAGFRWNDPVQGAWTRRLSDRQAAELDFQVVSIDQDEQRAVCA